MADMRARMAALRAKRAARFTKAAQDSHPKCTAALMAAAQAVGAPRTTWDEDYRERLAGTVDSSDDDDEDAIVVLPPPTVKLDPVAKRVAWRKQQRAAAAAQAAELVRDEYPAPGRLMSQPLTIDSTPKEDVDNEEQLLEEIELEGEGSSSEEEGGEEEQGAEDGVPSDEEAVPGAEDEDSEMDDDVLEQKKKLTEEPNEVPAGEEKEVEKADGIIGEKNQSMEDSNEFPVDAEEDSEVDDDVLEQKKQLTEESNDMETQPPAGTELANLDETEKADMPDSIDAETQPPKDGKPDSLDAETLPPTALVAQSSEGLVRETETPKESYFPSCAKSVVMLNPRQPDTFRETMDASPSSPKPSKNTFATMADTSNTLADSQRTVDSSRATLPLAAESSSTTKSTAWEALTCSSNENETRASKKKKTPMDTAVTVSSGALLGKFTKLGAMSSEVGSPSPPPKRKFGKFTKLSMLPVKRRGPESNLPCPFIEDEAEDELDADGMTQNIDSDDEDEIDALINDRVVADTQQEEGVSARLADFHRQWQNEADEDAIRETVKTVGREANVDNDIDLSELVQRQKERDEQAANAENDDDAASACGGNGNNTRGEDMAAVDEYVENMFRDENSNLMNEYGDDDNDEFNATPEERKRAARALWKARRKQMAERGARDPHAITLLNLFEEEGGEGNEADIEANVSRLRAQLVAATPVRNSKSKDISDDESDEEDDNNVGLGKKKRKLTNDSEKVVPEWQRRRQAMERLEKRRRTATCLGNWTLNSKVSAVEHTVAALRSPAAAPRMKRARAPPVGGSFGKPMLNAMPVQMGRFHKRVQAEKNQIKKKRPAAARKLFAALGERPKADAQ